MIACSFIKISKKPSWAILHAAFHELLLRILLRLDKGIIEFFRFHDTWTVITTEFSRHFGLEWKVNAWYAGNQFDIADLWLRRFAAAIGRVLMSELNLNICNETFSNLIDVAQINLLTYYRRNNDLLSSLFEVARILLVGLHNGSESLFIRLFDEIKRR
jgi:hypothetical protein